jgi:hypothetical protein
MGRLIYAGLNGEAIWKYVPIVQPSEQYRIAEELGIGRIKYLLPSRVPYCRHKKHYEDECPEECEDDCPFVGDILFLRRDDLPRLKKALEPHLGEIEKYEKERGDKDSIRVKKLINLTEKYPDIHFWRMVKAIVEYMERTDLEAYEFWGEYE